MASTTKYSNSTCSAKNIVTSSATSLLPMFSIRKKLKHASNHLKIYSSWTWGNLYKTARGHTLAAKDVCCVHGQLRWNETLLPRRKKKWKLKSHSMKVLKKRHHESYSNIFQEQFSQLVCNNHSERDAWPPGMLITPIKVTLGGTTKTGCFGLKQLDPLTSSSLLQTEDVKFRTANLYPWSETKEQNRTERGRPIQRRMEDDTIKLSTINLSANFRSEMLHRLGDRRGRRSPTGRGESTRRGGHLHDADLRRVLALFCQSLPAGRPGRFTSGHSTELTFSLQTY
jgi:hypothetical protein